jgi:hypothetical protein
MRSLLPSGICVSLGLASAAFGAQPAGPDLFTFTDKYCSSCHNDVDKEGGLDLTSLKFAPGDSANFLAWVKVHDRVQAGEMPPKEKKRPTGGDLNTFLKELGGSLTAADKAAAAKEGRVTQRRLNRYEFENSLRDLLQAPWLQVKNELPEDGESELFNKIGDVLDVSHVQMTRFMRAANQAIRHTIGIELARQELPPPTVKRYYARDNRIWTGTFKRVPDGNPDPVRQAFPVLGKQAQPDVFDRTAPLTVGDDDPKTREIEAIGWMRSNYHPFHTIWDNFRAPVAGNYRVRWSGYTIWVGPNGWSTGTIKNAAGKKELVLRDPQWNAPDGHFVAEGGRN